MSCPVLSEMPSPLSPVQGPMGVVPQRPTEGLLIKRQSCRYKINCCEVFSFVVGKDVNWSDAFRLGRRKTS